MALPDNKDRGLYRRINHAGQARWYVRIAVASRMRTFAPHGGFPNKKEAQVFLADTRARMRLGTFFPEQFKAIPFPLAKLLAADEDRVATHPDAKNQKPYRTFWYQQAGHLDARALSPGLIVDARDELARRKLSPQTIHHYLKYLRHLLNLAKRDELIDRSPFERVPLAPVHNLRERWYSLTERRKLYKALSEKWRAQAELAGLTGLRWSEQFTLERNRVNLREGFVTLPKTKAGRPQIRYLNQRARLLLRRQLGQHRTRWVYPNQAKTGPIDYANFRKRVWLPACEAAGIANARWNDWRHTFASDLTMQGHSDRTVAHLLGHTSTQMVRRYAHLAPSHLKDAVEGLGITVQKLQTARRKKRSRSA